MMQVKPSQLFEILKAAFVKGLNVLVVGGPGIAKSSIVAQAARAVEADIVISNPAVEDPTNGAGLPWVSGDKKTATFLPFGQLAKVLGATKLTVWDLEDLGNASGAVQAGYMHWLLAKELNGHKLPDCVRMVATTNRRTDRTGVSGILESVKSRFAIIVELVPDLDEWSNWYVQQDFMSPEILAYLRATRAEAGPEDAVGMLYQFTPSADIVNCPLPRTWEHASRVLQLGLSPAAEAAALAGAVGDKAATAFLGFRRMYRELPSLEGIIMDPDNAAIPDNLSALYAVSTGLAYMANENNFDQVAKYVQRMYNAGRGDFAVLCIRDATRKTPVLQQTPAFAIIMASEIGQLVVGAA